MIKRRPQMTNKREEIIKEVQKYVDENYKPVTVDYKTTDDGKTQYPVYNESMWPTIAKYIESKIAAARKETKLQCEQMYASEILNEARKPIPIDKEYLDREIASASVEELKLLYDSLDIETKCGYCDVLGKLEARLDELIGEK